MWCCCGWVDVGLKGDENVQSSGTQRGASADVSIGGMGWEELKESLMHMAC